MPRYRATESRRSSAAAMSSTAVADAVATKPATLVEMAPTSPIIRPSISGAKSVGTGVDVANSRIAAEAVHATPTTCATQLTPKTKNRTNGKTAIETASSPTGKSAAGRCSVAMTTVVTKLTSTAMTNGQL